MHPDDSFKQIEKVLDKHLAELSIWQMPFQSVISWLLLAIENIDIKGRSDVAMDYVSRLSYVYEIVREKSQTSPVVNTTQAILVQGHEQVIDDVNFIIAYAHFAMLMPQFHRDTFSATEASEQAFKIDFSNNDLKEAEIMDRLYSSLSLQMAVSYPEQATFDSHLLQKVNQKDTNVLTPEIMGFVKDLYDFNKQTSLNIQVLPDEIIQQELGFSFDDYLKFCAAVKAFMEYFFGLSRAYNTARLTAPDEDRDSLVAEYMEWAVCCINHKTSGFFQGLTGLSSDKFKAIFEYFMTTTSDTTTEGYNEKAVCGDGYYPPFIWMEDALLFSPLGTRYLLSFNNILYSLNKRSSNQFNQQISPHLEPALITQMDALFTALPDVITRKNINYTTGEIDYIVLSEKENTALCFQVKATIAPDSARTVKRVEDRALEGINQIQRFDQLPAYEKEHIINQAFGTSLTGISILNILIVRSCAGSAAAWLHNKQYPIVNYAFLASLMAKKVLEANPSIKDFDKEIWAEQDIMRVQSKADVKHETLKISGYEISFPYIEMDLRFVPAYHTRTLRTFPDFEKIQP